MEIVTKFDMNQNVHAIIHAQKQVRTTCKVCHGNETILVPNFGNTMCPDCYGKGYKETREIEKWYIPNDSYYHFKIKKIGIEFNFDQKNRNWIYYMSATSGTMFDEKDLFASYEEAQAECDKRNLELSK